MANEITLTCKLAVVNGNLRVDLSPQSIQIDQAAALAHGTVVSVGTSEETMPKGDIANEGLVMIYNLDSTNFVSYGTTTGNLDLRLNPGEPALVRLKAGSDILWQADTAACNVQMLALSN